PVARVRAPPLRAPRLPDPPLPCQQPPDQPLPPRQLPDQELPDQELPAHELPDQLLPDHELPFQVPPDHELPLASSSASAGVATGLPKMSCSPPSRTPSRATCSDPRDSSSSPVPVEPANDCGSADHGGAESSIAPSRISP